MTSPMDTAREALELAEHALTGIVVGTKKTIGGWETCQLTDFDFARTALAAVQATLSRGEAAENVVPLKAQARSHNDMLIDRVKGVPATPATAEDMAEPSNPNVYHHPEAGAPSREDVAYVIQNVKAERVDARGAAWVGEWSYEAADRILALFPTPPDKAVLGGMGEREAIVRIISEKVRLAPLVEDGIEVGAEIVGMHEAADAILALSERPAAEGWRPTHRHVKRGTVYRLTGQAVLQTDQPADDNVHLLVYQGADGLLWARPSAEFYDGRFEPLPANPALPQDVEMKEGGVS